MQQEVENRGMKIARDNSEIIRREMKFSLTLQNKK
jgi:hypothetical protein